MWPVLVMGAAETKGNVHRTSPALLAISLNGLKGINLTSCYGFSDGRRKRKERLAPGLHIKDSGISNSRSRLLVTCPGVLLHEVPRAVEVQPAWGGQAFINGLPCSGRTV